MQKGLRSLDSVSSDGYGLSKDSGLKYTFLFSSTTPVRVSETLASRLVSRGSPEGAKSKMGSSKENWLG